MPTYQYACTVESCGHQFDAFQAFSDDALTECPECSGRLRKVWGSIGVVFKGSGFYRNDSRQNGDSARKGSSESGSADKASDKSGDTAAAKATTDSGTSKSASKSESTSAPAKTESSSTRKPAAAAS